MSKNIISVSRYTVLSLFTVVKNCWAGEDYYIQWCNGVDL